MADTPSFILGVCTFAITMYVFDLISVPAVPAAQVIDVGLGSDVALCASCLACSSFRLDAVPLLASV